MPILYWMMKERAVLSFESAVLLIRCNRQKFLLNTISLIASFLDGKLI